MSANASNPAADKVKQDSKDHTFLELTPYEGKKHKQESTPASSSDKKGAVGSKEGQGGENAEEKQAGDETKWLKLL